MDNRPLLPPYTLNTHENTTSANAAHAICGTKTHIVTDVIVSDAGDAKMFKPLLDRTVARFNVAEVSGDKAYSSKANTQAAFDKYAKIVAEKLSQDFVRLSCLNL